MYKKLFALTVIFFFLIVNFTPYIYANEDCGFNGVKDRIQRALNAEKYWDRKINDLNENITQCKARIRSLYIDIKELRNSEFRKMRIQRAILDAKGYGADPEEARQKEIEDIREDFKITTDMIQVEKEMLKWLNGCLEKAQNERGKLR